MDNLNFDEAQLRQRIKERILLGINKDADGQSRSANIDNGTLQPLIDHHNIMDVQYYSHRRIVGKLIILFKRLARKLIHPILMKQIHFNQRVIDHLYKIDQTNVEIEKRVLGMTRDIVAMAVDTVVDEVSSVISKVSEETRDEIAALNRSLERYEVSVSTSLLVELAELEYGNDNFERSYHLLLLAQRKSPDDLEIENKIIQSFDRMMRSRNI